MNREAKKYLFDIITSINSIEQFIGENKDFLFYENNKLLRRGVEREIEIIGEAMTRLLKINPKLDIKNARQIIDTRNWVIHGYDKVDNTIVWGIVSNHLPKLKSEVEALLNEV